MYRFAKLIHLVGLTLFVGSIFGHIVTGLWGGQPGAATFLAARETIALATRYLTLPGLALTLISGVAMVVLSGLSPLRQRWLLVHAGLAVAVVAVSVAIVAPAGQHILAGALALAHNDPAATTAAILDAKSQEDFFGPLNLALALGAIVVGVFRPKFARRTRPANVSLKSGVSSTP